MLPFEGPGIARTLVKEVLVFGSYARGAIECGDLDLVVDMDVDWIESPRYRDGRSWGGAPGFSKVKVAALGRFADVEVFPIQDAEKIDDGAALAGAVSIWKPGKDWRAAIASIAVMDGAGRHDRLVDQLPLGLEQTSMNLAEGEAVAQACLDGVLEVVFHPFADKVRSDDPRLSESERTELDFFSRAHGKDRQAMAPMVLLATRGWQCDLREVGSFARADEGDVLRFGSQRLVVDEFDSLAVRSISLIPFWSRRGPNGMATFRRGPQHPLVRQFDRKVAYTVGETAVFICLDDKRRPRGYPGCALYTTCERAAAAALTWVADGDELPEIAVAWSGRALHDLVAGCWVAEVDDQDAFGVGIPKHCDQVLFVDHSLSFCEVDDLLAALPSADGSPDIAG